MDRLFSNSNGGMDGAVVGTLNEQLSPRLMHLAHLGLPSSHYI